MFFILNDVKKELSLEVATVGMMPAVAVKGNIKRLVSGVDRASEIVDQIGVARHWNWSGATQQIGDNAGACKCENLARFVNSHRSIDTNAHSWRFGLADAELDIIDVDAAIENDSLVITISDHGPGVSDEELPLLKEKYKRIITSM